MTLFVDRFVVSWLSLLADWSVRWGVVLMLLAAWLALRPPRRAVTRYLLCSAALAAGVLVPVAPRWGNLAVTWNVPRAGANDEVAEPAPPSAWPHGAWAEAALSSVASEAQTARSRSIAGSDAVFRSTQPLGKWRVAALAVAVAWASVVLVLLIRLAGGWLMLARLSRGAFTVRGSSDELFRECREALGLSRPVRLAAHAAVTSPVVIGGVRPIILVPSDWADWPEPHRRACLLHELAHVARYDDWAKLAQEFLRAPFFFHPLVRWLLVRLDREREMLCDEAVVALGTEPAGYARLLLDLARRPGRILSASAGLHPVLLPFLDRRTIAVRISRLLEDDMLHSLSRASAGRSLILGSLALAAALCIGGIRVHAVEPQAKKDTPAATQSAPATATARTVEGVILDPDGKPVADAVVVAGIEQTGKPNHQVFRTDDAGRFTWSIPEGPVSVYFVAYKDAYSPTFWMKWMDASLREDRVEIKLTKPEPFAAILVDATGKALAGAKVQVEMTAHSFEIKDGPVTQSGSSYCYVRREVIAGSPVEGLFVTTTNADGSFDFRWLAPNSGMKLRVTDGEGRILLIKPDTRAVQRPGNHMEEQGFVTSATGENGRLVTIPAARIAGRVVTKLSGVGVAGLTAYYQDSRQPGVYRPMTNFGAEARTDADGRFAFDGLSQGTINVFVHGDGENKNWTYRAAKDVNLSPGATSEITIELIRGVQVEGTVIAQGTGIGLDGAEVGVQGPVRPSTSAATAGAKTDAKGRYRYRLPAGETFFYVMSPPRGFTAFPQAERSHTLTIPDRTLTFEVPPIALEPAATMRGHVLDSSGKPIAGAKVVGICENGLCRPFPGQETVTDARGEFRLPPGMYNTVAIGKAARLLIKLPGGVEHQATATPAADGAVTVKLPDAGDGSNGVE